MLTNLDMPQFTTNQVAMAADVPLATLAAQFQRKQIVLGPDAALNGGQGRTRFFSLRRALHVVLTQELARSGVDVRQAGNMALQWTDLPDQNATIVTEPDAPISREACQLYPGGTVFHLVNVVGVGPIGSVRRRSETPSETAVTVTLVDLDALVARTLDRLGIAQ